MAAYQYRDLPQIPGFPSEESQYATTWGQEHLALRHASTSEVDFSYIETGNNMIRARNMERFLLDASPLSSGLLHANLHHGLPQQRHSLNLFQQWPAPEQSRYDSPDRTSISGNSSYATQNEIRSPRAYPSASYGNPEDIVLSSSPYPAVNHFKQEPLLPDHSHTGGNVNLRDLELYNHEMETEQIVDEGDATSIKAELDGTYEPDPDYVRVDSGQESYHPSSDSGVSRSRDAESVQPMELSEGETSDADYNPVSTTRRRRSSASTSNSGRQIQRRRSATKRKNSSVGTTSVATKRGVRGPGKAKSDAFTVDSQRHFPCSLTPYNCISTFSSKNEWKRHVSTQHIKQGFWRCDLCATTVDPHDRETVYHNDFNRKDLFRQHLRRMHAAPATQSHRSQKEYPVTEGNVANHEKRCFTILRETPTRSRCLFCDETFSGPNSWDSRMEHVGRHLEKDRKSGNSKIWNVDSWNKDPELERWYYDEGIITFDQAGHWKIGDGRPRRQGVSDDDTSDEDA